MTAKKKPSAPAKPDANTLQIVNDKGKTKERQFAEVGLSATTLNAVTARTFTKTTMGETDLSETIAVMQDKVAKVNAGDLSDLEATVTAQAVALDAMFNAIAGRAVLNMGQGQYMQAAETYMRLALKAQAQCARTIEVLTAMKTPPVVLAKQANISNGHQQVNNNVTSTPALAHTGKTVNQQNELLEHQQNGEWLDTGKTAAASGTDKAMAALE